MSRNASTASSSSKSSNSEKGPSAVTAAVAVSPTLSDHEPLLRGSTTGRNGTCCKGCFSTAVAVCASLSGFCFGYEIGIIDSVLAMDSFRLYFTTGAYDVDNGGVVIPSSDAPSTNGWIVSTFLFGCMLGSIIVSGSADALGRKASILVGSVLFTVGGIVQASAVSLGALYGGRFISGSGIGMLSMVAPLYISETAASPSRGFLISVQQMLITAGILVASCVNSALYLAGGDLGDTQWRAALAAQVIPGAGLFLIVLFLPRSPRWLAYKGFMAEAALVLGRLRNLPAEDAAVKEELEGIITELEAEEGVVLSQPSSSASSHAPHDSDSAVGGITSPTPATDHALSPSSGSTGDDVLLMASSFSPPLSSQLSTITHSATAELADGRSGALRVSKFQRSLSSNQLLRPYISLFTDPSNLKPLLLVCMLQLFQQLTGINIVLYYAADLFQHAGIGREISATYLVIANAALLVIGTVPGMVLVDRPGVGRRPLLLWGALAMAICHGAITVFLASMPAAGGESSSSTALTYAAVASMLCFTVAFSASWGPVVWVVQNEILPLKVRAQGTACGTLVNWASNALIGKVAPLLLAAAGEWTYCILSGLCVLMGIWVFLCLPETSGLSLEEMSILFLRKGVTKNARVI